MCLERRSGADEQAQTSCRHSNNIHAYLNDGIAATAPAIRVRSVCAPQSHSAFLPWIWFFLFAFLSLFLFSFFLCSCSALLCSRPFDVLRRDDSFGCFFFLFHFSFVLFLFNWSEYIHLSWIEKGPKVDCVRWNVLWITWTENGVVHGLLSKLCFAFSMVGLPAGSRFEF